MTQIKTQVKAYRIDKVCPACKEGLLIATGTAYYFSFYTTYHHRCNICGKEIYLQNEKYPHEITEDIGKPEIIKEQDNTLVNEQNIVNEINYNNLCAKATLGEVPTVTLESLSGTITCPDCQGEGYTYFINQGEPDLDSKCTTCKGIGKLKKE